VVFIMRVLPSCATAIHLSRRIEQNSWKRV
jgi:hypothetical protein